MRAPPNRPFFAAAAAAASLLIGGALLVSSFLHLGPVSPLAGFFSSRSTSIENLKAVVLHYATTPDVPQQSRAEISLTFNVLRRRSPCNLLVFGLGLDSAMWAAFNSAGTTVFLEENQEWIRKVVVGSSSTLVAHHIPYRTRLDEADELMRSYKSVPECMLPAVVKGNRRCRLALAELPEQVLETEWDVIMVDAPRGYFPAAPGRMSAIWTAGAMARARRGPGETDVFVHDVERRVEKMFAREFLCEKFRAGGTGRLWHFRIPASNVTETTFC